MNIYLKIMMLFLILGTASCSSGNSNSAFAQLEAKKFQQKWENEKTTSVLIDVRTMEEYNGGHIESAKNIDFNGSNFESEITKIDKEKTIFIYCLSGGRSSAAVSFLEKKGYSNVIELVGGMMAWRSEGLPETKLNSQKESSNFVDFIAKNELVLVDFYADWCAPCKKMKPILNNFSTNNTISVLPLNADIEQQLVAKFGVINLPTLVLIKSGKEVWRGEGFHSKDQLTEIVNRFK
jgi:thioredoxin 1